MSKRKIKPKNPDKSRGTGRTRNFATVVYPTEDEYKAYYRQCGGDVADRNGVITHVEEYDGRDGWGSHPNDWKQKLIDQHVAVFISPMHIGDHNPDGSIKKPHWHVMIIYESVKDYDSQVKPLFDSIGGVGREEVGSARGYARYLCHLDNPEKCQYSPAEVTCYGGANWEAITNMPGDDPQIKREIEKFIQQNRIYSYAEACDVLAANNLEWYNVLERNTYHFTQFVRSLIWEEEHEYVRAADRIDNSFGAATTGNTAGEEKGNESED